VYQGVGSLETGLLSTPPEKLGFKPVKNNSENGSQDVEFPEAKQEIEEGLHKLETLLNSTVDKNFDKFEIYVLRNILSVPAALVNWVRLDHYEVKRRPLRDRPCWKSTNDGRIYPTHRPRTRPRQKVYNSSDVNWPRREQSPRLSSKKPSATRRC
jgi:kinetochore protein Mis12/MTW1